MIMATIKNNITLPKLNFQKDLKVIADRIFIPALQAYIDRQVQVDGGAYPPLEPATLKKKRGEISKRLFTKKGSIRQSKKLTSTIESTGLTSFSAKTLIQTGDLRKSFESRNRGKSSVVISLNSNRKEVGDALQIKGVGKKRKKFQFFGVSKEMESKAYNYMNEKVREQINAAKK